MKKGKEVNKGFSSQEDVMNILKEMLKELKAIIEEVRGLLLARFAQRGNES